MRAKKYHSPLRGQSIFKRRRPSEGRGGGGGGGGVDGAVDRLELGPRTTLLIVFATAFERSENETQEMRAAAAAPSRIRGFLLSYSISFSVHEVTLCRCTEDEHCEAA